MTKHDDALFNVKPLVTKDEIVPATPFSEMFIRSYNKISQLKGIQTDIKHLGHEVLFFKEWSQRFDEEFYIWSIMEKNCPIALLALNPSLVETYIESGMGGNKKILDIKNKRELTSTDQVIITNINALFLVSLREGMKVKKLLSKVEWGNYLLDTEINSLFDPNTKGQLFQWETKNPKHGQLALFLKA
jgi:flagellar motor switch protein FliM